MSELLVRYGPGRVYYIAAGPFVKVGFSESVKDRMCELQVGNPVELELLYIEPGDEELEAERHSELARFRHRGEWFHRTPTEAFIAQLKAALGVDHEVFARPVRAPKHMTADQRKLAIECVRRLDRRTSVERTSQTSADL